MWRLWIKGKLRNRICLSILLLLSFSTVAICGERRILVLHSYDPKYIYTRIFNDTLERELQEKDYSIDLFYEFLDAKRFDPGGYYDKFKEYIKSKYANQNIDIILCFDDDALNFLIAHRKDLGNLSDIPVVFGSVANRALIYFAALEGNMTGVFEDLDVAANVDLMLQILPVRHVFVVTDRTTLGIDLYEIARLIFKRLGNLSVEYLIGLPWNEMKERFEDAPEGSAILLISYLRDEQNNVYTVERVSELLNEINLPVVTLLTPLVNLKGGLASYAPTPETQIKAVVKILDSVLAGQDIRFIPITMELPKNFLVDFSKLKRFHISPASLPKNSIILNIPDNFYRKYKSVLLPVIFIVSILFILILFLIINIRQRKIAERKLNREVAFLMQLVETIPDAICYMDNDGSIILWNHAFENYLLPTCSNIKGCKISDCIADISLAGDIELSISNAIANDKVLQPAQILFKDKANEAHYLDIQKRPIRNGENILGTLVVMTDITTLIQMQESLKGQKRRLELTLMGSNVGYFERNVKTDELHMNPFGYELLGYTEDDIKTFSQFEELVHPEDREELNLSLKRTFESANGNYRMKYRLRRKNGEYMWMGATGLVVERDLEGNPLIFAGIFWNITEEKLKEAETAQLIEGLYVSSMSDPLTGILNRNGLQNKLPDLVSQCKKLGKKLSLILFDIDDFKKINDTYGHLIGDSVLKELSELVNGIIRKDDLFVRWGGDEFLIVSMIPLEEALCIADRLIRIVEGRSFSGLDVTVSVGISTYLPNEPVEEAIKRADKALYRAKAKGKNSVVIEYD